MASGLDLARRFSGFDSFKTPKVVVDEPTLLRNIAAMAELVGGKATLHPHIKTHKSLEIAHLQRAHGAKGFTVARPYEAKMLIENGLTPVTLAYPIICPATIAAMLRIVERPEDIRFVADSEQTVEAVAKAALECGRVAHVFLKVNVGLHRCGFDPRGVLGLALARKIDADPLLHFVGLLSHAGHAYGAGNVDGVRRIAQTELEIMTDLRASFERNGIPVPCVSIGSTPSILANAGFEGIDEVRPGNYVFYDLTAVRLGLVSRADIGLAVSAQIIAVNDHFAIADVGSKTLSSDLGAHGTSATTSFGEAWAQGRDTPFSVAKLSEEHAFLTFEHEAPKLGIPVLILPNHSCPVANLSGGLSFTGKRARLVPTEGFIRHDMPSP
ncbi:alanine racemase [Rhizobium nepotum]|uniref:alanine racemase n=1 Tax=Rhizobium nepotum TaxID=1035271 RepID=UPI003CEF1AD0